MALGHSSAFFSAPNIYSIRIYCEPSMSLLLVALLDDLSYSLTRNLETSYILFTGPVYLCYACCAKAPAYASCDEFH